MAASNDPNYRRLRDPFWTWQEADTPIQRALYVVVHSGDRSDGCSSISILGALSDFSPPNGARGTLGRLISLHGSPAARKVHARRTVCRAVADLRVLELNGQCTPCGAHLSSSQGVHCLLSGSKRSRVSLARHSRPRSRSNTEDRRQPPGAGVASGLHPFTAIPAAHCLHDGARQRDIAGVRLVSPSPLHPTLSPARIP